MRAPALFLAALAAAPVLLAQAPDHRCGTPPRNPLLMPPAMSPDCSYTATDPKAEYAPSFLYEITVVVHVIQHTDGRGAISPALVRSQIDILNEDFRAAASSNGGNGFDSRIQFRLATRDPQGNATTGITYSTNNTWFDDNGSYWNSLAWDTNRYLNIYTNSAQGFLGYVPGLPQNGNLVGTAADRVVVLWSSFGKDAPIGPPYDQGRTTTHEVGHYLGLFHTFDGRCGSSSCYTTGDLICDTAAESRPRFGCPGSASSCGSPDPTDNYMDYTDDLCMERFTSEQSRRMRCTLAHWRPDLAIECPVATVSNRNAGTNPQSYTATLPVIGEIFTATIDVASTGHSHAALFGYTGSDNVPLPNGSVVLFDLSSQSLLPLPAVAGPIAEFRFRIPNLVALCGLELFTQAAHVGGQPDFVLTNAQDLLLGK